MLPPAGGLIVLGDGQAPDPALISGKCGPEKTGCGPVCQFAGPAAGRPSLAII